MSAMTPKVFNASLNFTDVNKTVQSVSENDGYNVEPSDATWILTSAFIIFAMQSGFGLLESGMASRKNETNIMVKNAVDVIYGALAYYLFGFGLSFGKGKYSNSFCGFGYFLVQTDNSNEEGWLHAKYFFHLSFATTATTIVSGAMAERVYLKSYTLFAFFHVFSYCFPAHWVWDRQNGWLHKMGFVDVAGASVVHVVGGVSGLVATMMLKPRHKRFASNGVARPMEVSCPTNVLLGTFILWWGWLGFNCGSTFGVSSGKWKLAARSAVCTLHGSVGGGFFAIVYSYIFKTNALNISTFATGVISGLVSITAICAIARPWEALMIGAIGSAFACLGCRLLERLQIDDPVNCVPTHAFAGIWAVISVSLFAEKDDILENGADYNGIFKGGSIRFLGLQLFGITTIICWAIVTCYAILYVINKFMGLRVTFLQEVIGADHHEHGITDINDPEGLLQIRKFLPRGTKIRLAQKRKRMSLKNPRQRAVYSFSDPNTKTRKVSEANGNVTNQVSRDHGYTLRKLFRQSRPSPTITRAQHRDINANAGFVDDSIVCTDGRFQATGVNNDCEPNQSGQQQEEALSVSQVCVLISCGQDSTTDGSASHEFEEDTERPYPSLVH